jgi:hypothetical protein
MATLGPDDPRAITGKAREEAQANTERWNALLGIKPMTKAERKRYEDDLADILNIIGYEEGTDTDADTPTAPPPSGA